MFSSALVQLAIVGATSAPAPAPAAAPATPTAPAVAAPAAPSAAPTPAESAPAVPASPPEVATPAPVADPAPAAVPSPKAAAPVATPPPPATARRPKSKPTKDGTGLLAAGLSITGGTYLLTSLAGAIALDKAKDNREEDNPLTEENEAAGGDSDRKRGRALLIPVAGPFMALKHTDSALRSYGLALNGTLQVTGVVLAIIGAVRHSRYKQAKRWGVVANAGRSGAQAGFKVRF